MSGKWRIVAAVLALATVAFSGLKLSATTAGLSIDSFQEGAIPVTVFRQEQATGPLVVLVHGFAGSRPLMQPFAITLARNGYIAATFDLSGHGRNLAPLTGDLTQIDGATQVLVNDVTRVADALQSRLETTGPLAVLGHSMSSDIAVRFAQSRDDVLATIGVSLFSPAITADSPRNLLIINGALEGRFKESSRALLSQLAPQEDVQPEVTYGSLAAGNVRRLVEADSSEHVGVLFSQESMSEALDWLNLVFGRQSQEGAYTDRRGGYIALLVVSIVLLWWSLASFLPRLKTDNANSGLTGLKLAGVLLIPMLSTPLLLHWVPTDFLPVLVGDYLAVHFLLYGLLTVLFARLFRRSMAAHSSAQRHLTPIAPMRLALTTLALLLMSAPLCMVIHWQIASFLPTPARLPLMFAVLIGTLSWFMADEWVMREQVRWTFAYLASKCCFLVSLGIAVALNFEGLFFLLLIVPVMVPLLLVFGLLSRWSHASTGSALPAALNNAAVFAWAIAVTFPLVQ